MPARSKRLQGWPVSHVAVVSAAVPGDRSAILAPAKRLPRMVESCRRNDCRKSAAAVAYDRSAGIPMNHHTILVPAANPGELPGSRWMTKPGRFGSRCNGRDYGDAFKLELCPGCS